jgi:hypothetical protein
METVSAIDDDLSLDALIEEYRSERDPAVPPFGTAISVLTRVGDRLHDDTKDTLVRKGGLMVRREGIPPGSQLSARVVARILDRSKTGSTMTQSAYRAYLARQPGAQDGAGGDAVTDEQVDESEAVIYFDPYTDDTERMVVPASDLTALMASVLPEVERARSRHERARSRSEDIADGKISDRALTGLEYSRRYDVEGAIPAFLFIGWLPGLVAGIIAGIIVALITWNGLLFLPIALGGPILGYLATLGLVILFLVVDVRWLRLGDGDWVSGVIFLGTGPAVALLIALLILSLA